VTGGPEEAARAKLNTARAAYDASVEKYRADACDWFDKRERTAREKGDKKQVDLILEERRAFEDRDELPSAAPPAVKDILTKAQKTMDAAYRAGVAEHTMAKNDADAAAVEKEWDRFKRNEVAPRIDRLQPGTVWTGASLAGGAGSPARVNDKLVLTILERDGERFKARFVVSPTTTRVIQGHIVGRRVWWTAADVAVEKGTTKGVDNFGYINGKQIRMRFVGRNEKGAVSFGVEEFRLVEAK
jgi:hypothetical protein